MSLLREDVEYDINGVYFGAQKGCKVVGQALNPPPLSLSTTLFSCRKETLMELKSSSNSSHARRLYP